MLSRFSRVRPCATLWTEVCQAPLSVVIIQAMILGRCCALLQVILLTESQVSYVSCTGRRVPYH